MNDEVPYWTAFNYVKGIGAVRFSRLLEYFGSAEKAWNADVSELRLSGLPEKVLSILIKFRENTDPQVLLNSIESKGIHVCILTDSSYPKMLKEINNPPPVLYVVGKIPSSDQKFVAVVGTRRMTNYGREMANQLSSFLAENGIVIVSGLARGIDGVAHQAALNSGGKTVAVLGSGVNIIYPPEHRNLAAQIVHNNGAVISDYAPDTPPDKINFPLRNRIISGLSSACLVIEAGEKSGSLITARFAAEQGREVFVVPGNFNAPQSRGANRLIRDGARPLFEKKELLEFLQTYEADNPVYLSKPLQMSFEDEEEKRILDIIDVNEMHIDEISRISGIPVGKVTSKMLLMELKGFVEEVFPGVYKKKQDAC